MMVNSDSEDDFGGVVVTLMMVVGVGVILVVSPRPLHLLSPVLPSPLTLLCFYHK